MQSPQKTKKPPALSAFVPSPVKNNDSFDLCRDEPPIQRSGLRPEAQNIQPASSQQTLNTFDNGSETVLPVSVDSHGSPMFCTQPPRHETKTTFPPVNRKLELELSFDSEDGNSIEQTLTESDDSFDPSSGKSSPTSMETSQDSLSFDDNTINDEEVISLFGDLGAPTDPSSLANISGNEVEARQIATEDHWSSLFLEQMATLWEDMHISTVYAEEVEDIEKSNFDPEQRVENQRRGGLPKWDYSSAFDELEIRLDDADSALGERYIHEANNILNNVMREVRLSVEENETVSATSVSRMQLLELFLPGSVLEKLKAHVNRVLKAKHRRLTTALEIKGIIITHVLAASYHSSVSVITAPENQKFFYQTGVSGERYNEIWSSLSCTARKRQRVSQLNGGWSNKPIAGNALITELEQELAAINRQYLQVYMYIAAKTVFSLDDDHQRLRSRAVTELTNLSHLNNPQKALGPVNNAICSALTSTFLASHYSRPGEKLIHVWERLVMLIQGAATPGSLQPMTDAVFAADRGYNTMETIDFLNCVLGATGIGTHKRSLDFPFVWGDGPIRKRHKGMVVSERGCRAIYSATRGRVGNNGRKVEAIVYRESVTGRIAAIYHNFKRMFGANTFTLIPKDGYRHSSTPTDLRRISEVYSRSCSSMSTSATEHHATTRSVAKKQFMPRIKVEMALKNVTHYTLLQAEDPGWFLARAFKFTSRTTQGFVTTFASDYKAHLKGLAYMLCGKEIMTGADVLPATFDAAETVLDRKWRAVLSVFNMSIRERPSEHPSQATFASIMASTAESLNALRKEDLLAMLANIGHRASSSLRKQQLVSKVMELQKNIADGAVQLHISESEIDSSQSSEQTEAQQMKLKVRLYEASLSAWFMKPLVSTPGMKEGSFNERQVLKAFPLFFRNHMPVNPTDLQDKPSVRYRVKYLRTVGLIGSDRVPLLAGSPDGIAALSSDEGDSHVTAIEVKTMTSLSTIEAAKSLREKHGSLVFLHRIGYSATSMKLFHELVPTTSYRLQCMHHCAVLGKQHVLFTVAKGSSMGIGEIIYCVLLQFEQQLSADYLYCVSTVRLSAFMWIGKHSKNIPKAYDELLSNSHATDLFSYTSFYNLSKAYTKLSITDGPLPPARMIRPSGLVFWNLVKGGVDEFSRDLAELVLHKCFGKPHRQRHCSLALFTS